MVTRRAAADSAGYAPNSTATGPIVPPSALTRPVPGALVFGASGPVGHAIVARLLESGWHVLAVSRQAREGRPGLAWLQGALEDPPLLPGAVDAVFSCGPLDAFARWYTGAAVRAPRVVACGSTSAQTKADSPRAAERALAARLIAAEQAVLGAGARRRAGPRGRPRPARGAVPAAARPTRPATAGACGRPGGGGAYLPALPRQRRQRVRTAGRRAPAISRNGRAGAGLPGTLAQAG